MNNKPGIVVSSRDMGRLEVPLDTLPYQSVPGVNALRDELMINSNMYDHAARLRSCEIVADSIGAD